MPKVKPTPIKMERFHLRVPIKVYDALVKECELDLMTMTEYIREAIKDRIRRRRRERRARGLEFDAE